MNTSTLKDVMRILEGPFKGKQGPIEHMLAPLNICIKVFCSYRISITLRMAVSSMKGLSLVLPLVDHMGEVIGIEMAH